MGNFWIDRKVKRTLTPLDRVGVRRAMFYIQKKLMALFQEKLHTGAPDYWLQAKLKELFDELRRRGLFEEYNVIVTDDLVMVDVQPRNGLPWINIELELKTNESENENEQFLVGQEEL